MVDSVLVRLKNASVSKKACKHNRIQWNAGTACVSECVLKTLACRALRVGPSKFILEIPLKEQDFGSLVALHRAMRLRFGYGFESCDANGPRNAKNTNLAKHRPVFLHPLLLVGSKKLVLKVPERGQFHAAIRVTI